MTGPLEEQDDASTPLTEEELADLIPSYISLLSRWSDRQSRAYY